MVLFETFRTIEHGTKYQYFDEHISRLQKSAQDCGFDNVQRRILLFQKQLRSLVPFEQEKRIKISLGTNAFQMEVSDLDLEGIQRCKKGIVVRDVVFERPKSCYKYQTEVYEQFMPSKEDVWQETIFIDKQGCVREGNITNILFVFKNTIVTPPVESVLPGIMRQKVLEKVLAKGLEVEERLLTKEEALASDHVFVTNSVKGIVPVLRWGEKDFEIWDL